MELTREVVESRAAEYVDEEPLYDVEDLHLDILPEMFAEGEFGRRDPMWVVRWYYRRYLGAYPDRERRVAEDVFGGNPYGELKAAITGAAEAPDAAAKLDHLTALEGVDVPIGSALLMFIDPGRYLVVGTDEWTVLHDAGELADPYPDDPTVDDYETYLETCRDLADRFDCDLVTLYRAVWRLRPGR